MRVVWIIVSVIVVAVSVSTPARAQQPAPPAGPTDIEDDAPASDPEHEVVTLEQLQARLRGGNVEQRRTAAIEMGLLGDARAVPLLVGTLRDDKASVVRAAAARALGTLKAKKGVGPLRWSASGDPDPSVKRAARAALASMGQAVAAPGVHRTVRPRQGTLPRVDTSYKRTTAYHSGRRLRMSGILLTVAGGGLGLLIGAITAAAHVRCQDEYPAAFPDEHKVHCANNLSAAIVGFVIAGASVGAGVPMWVVGGGRMEAARRRHKKKVSLVPRLGLAPDRVTLGWQF